MVPQVKIAKTYTGEGFPSERFLAYAGLVLSGAVLLIMFVDHIQSSKQRKIDMELSKAQLEEIKAKNGK